MSEQARALFEQAKAGGRCPAEVIAESGLAMPDKRLVEVALRAEEIAEVQGISTRDALHQMNYGARTKAQVAEWLCPDAAGDWAGDSEQRRAARDASEVRARERMYDRVLANAQALDPADKSLGAQQLRETAASVRDHRAMAQRRLEWAARDAEETS
jgi:hypothetical protein